MLKLMSRGSIRMRRGWHAGYTDLAAENRLSRLYVLKFLDASRSSEILWAELMAKVAKM